MQPTLDAAVDCDPARRHFAAVTVVTAGERCLMSKSILRIDSFVQRALATSLSAASLLLSAGQPAHAQSQQGADTLQVEEIVVTARKREESLLDTPIAIAAFSAADIEAKGIVTFNQMADMMPGINISNVAAGRSDRSFQQISLRGFVPSTTLSTLTATFIDGVPVASPTAVMSVTDPARIEILKGPQAAYFGRNTFSGAVNVVNKTPGEEFGGSVMLMAGTRSNLDFTATLEGPLLGDKLGFRVTARQFERDGSYKNQANPGETLGDQQTRTFTALLDAKPTENLAAKLFVLYSEDDDGPSAQGMLSSYEVRANNGLVNVPAFSGSTAGTVIVPGLGNCTLNGFLNGAAANEPRQQRRFICGAAPGLPAGFSPAQNTVEDSLLANALASGVQRVVDPGDGVDGYGLVREYWHAHLNVDYKFGESGFTLSSLTGINDEFYSELADLDNYDNTLIANPVNPTGANPNLRRSWDFLFAVERETRDFSQEFRLSYDNDGPFNGVFGVSYLKTLVWNDLVGITFEIVSGTPRVPQAGKNLVETQSAFFGGTYEFTDKFSLSLEGRYQQDEVTGFTGSNPMGLTVLPTNQFGLTPGFYGPLTELISAKYKEFLPRVIAQYEFNDDMMAYASYSKGINVGTNTFNTAFLNGSSLVVQTATELGLTVVQKPEELTNYEVGFKGRFLDGRVLAQAAVYVAEWTNQLNTRNRFITDLPASQGGTGTIQQVNGLANTGASDLQGIELDITAKATENLDINFAAAMNDSEYKSFTAPGVSQLTGLIGDDFKGKQLPQVSKYSVNLGAQYGRPISAWDDASWFARADWAWKDKLFLDASNITWIKARSVLNLRAGITRGPLSIDAFVLNALDNDDYVSISTNVLLTPTNIFNAAATGNGASVYLNTGLPDLRTYGARISYRF
jgi:iron complex outermembrane receptor protein